MTTLYYRWANNEHRRDLLYGRPCRVLARGRMNSVLVEFSDNRFPRKTLCSWRALSETPPRVLEPSLF